MHLEFYGSAGELERVLAELMLGDAPTLDWRSSLARALEGDPR